MNALGGLSHVVDGKTVLPDALLPDAVAVLHGVHLREVARHTIGLHAARPEDRTGVLDCPVAHGGGAILSTVDWRLPLAATVGRHSEAAPDWARRNACIGCLRAGRPW